MGDAVSVGVLDEVPCVVESVPGRMGDEIMPPPSPRTWENVVEKSPDEVNWQ
jgi:hypothetical protein